MGVNIIMIVHSSKNPLIIREGVTNNIIEENKTTIKKIADKVFPIASKILDRVTKESGFKYLCDKKYITYSSSYVNMYDENNEDSVNEFGTFTLFEIVINKVLSSNNSTADEFDWNKWEDNLFKLCKELNSNKEISKYGKAYTEQPDDGDQINFKVNKSLLNTNTAEVIKTGLSTLTSSQYSKLSNNLLRVAKSIYNEFKEELSKETEIPGSFSPPYGDYKLGRFSFMFKNSRKSTEKEEIPSDLKQKFDNIMNKLVSKYNKQYDNIIEYKIVTRDKNWLTWIEIKFNINDDNYMNFLKQ